MKVIEKLKFFFVFITIVIYIFFFLFIYSLKFSFFKEPEYDSSDTFRISLFFLIFFIYMFNSFLYDTFHNFIKLKKLEITENKITINSENSLKIINSWKKKFLKLFLIDIYEDE